jgi:hypothetical protein
MFGSFDRLIWDRHLLLALGNLLSALNKAVKTPNYYIFTLKMTTAVFAKT